MMRELVEWWRCFLERNNDLTLRCGDSTDHVRMAAVSILSFKGHVKHNLLHSPSQNYNMDESGIPNVVALKGSKKVRYRSSGRKGKGTIVASGNAAGQVIPPMRR